MTSADGGADRIYVDTLIARLRDFSGDRRRLVAIAGPPASGKSSLAERAEAALNAEAPGRAAVLPMDGFHFDDDVLRARGLLARKGAPDTFDVGGLAALLRRLRENAEPEIATPVFDRAIEIARAGARIIPRSVEIVLVEGNYLLVDAAPWRDLAAWFDLRVMVEVSEAARRRRLQARWAGLGLDDAAIRTKTEENDIPNGRYVIDRSGRVDLIVANEG